VLQKCQKDITFVVAIRCILSSSKYTKTRFRPGLCLGPHWGAYDASQPPWLAEEGDTSTDTLPLDSFGISICPHPIKIPGYVYVLVNIIDNARLIRRKFDNLTTFVNFDNLTIPGNYHFTIKKLTSDWLH